MNRKFIKITIYYGGFVREDLWDFLTDFRPILEST